jgi:predicted amidohydrolase YtcJ
VTADVSALSQKLSSFGITGFTDTSATNSQQTQRLFADWQASGALQQRILLMGDDSLTSGPLKVILDEDALPTLQSLITRLQQARARGRSFAFHCVTHLELLFALTALAEVEPDPRDRIEHAAIVYDTMLPLLKEHGVSVVTQPGFLWQRGDQYLTDLTALEVASLYRHKALLDFGINTIVSSDAPYGPLDPWQVMRAANQRCTRAGVVIGAAERVAPEQSLRGYLLHGQALQAPVRKVEPGADADLCLLNKPWSAIKKQLAEAQVQATICAGKVVYRR